MKRPQIIFPMDVDNIVFSVNTELITAVIIVFLLLDLSVLFSERKTLMDTTVLLSARLLIAFVAFSIFYAFVNIFKLSMYFIKKDSCEHRVHYSPYDYNKYGWNILNYFSLANFDELVKYALPFKKNKDFAKNYSSNIEKKDFMK